MGGEAFVLLAEVEVFTGDAGQGDDLREVVTVRLDDAEDVAQELIPEGVGEGRIGVKATSWLKKVKKYHGR